MERIESAIESVRMFAKLGITDGAFQEVSAEQRHLDSEEREKNRAETPG